MTENETQRKPERTRLLSKLKQKAYRDSYVASHINAGIPFQIRAIRKSRDLTQKALAKLSGMTQNRISKLENPDGAEPNIRTLRSIASAFDCALVVRFVPYSELVDWTTSLGVGSLDVPSFSEDHRLYEEARNDNLSPIAAFSSVSARWLPNPEPAYHIDIFASLAAETTSGIVDYGSPLLAALPSGEDAFSGHVPIAAKIISSDEPARMNPFNG